MKSNEKLKNILREFGEKSTVAGLHYAFEPRQSKVSNVIWIAFLIVLTFFGIFTSVNNYKEWKAEPVVTTLASTGLPISEVPFPSIVICSEGADFESFYAALYKVLIENSNRTLNLTKFTPIKLQKPDLFQVRTFISVN